MKWLKAILQRLFDIIASCVALTVLTPVFTVACIKAAISHKPVLLHRPVTSTSGRRFRRLYFSSLRPVAALPTLFNILRGDMTIEINLDINITSQ